MTNPATTETGWRLIDSAPKDMTEIIGMNANGTVSNTWFCAPSSRTQKWLRRCGGPWRPTHWMPLPPPPSPIHGGTNA